MPQYRFDVEANIKDAEKDINQLYSLLGKLDTAAKKSGNIDNFQNDKNTLGLLNKYKEIEQSYDRINNAAQKYAQSTNFEGNTSDIQHLNDKLGDTSSLLSKVSQGINSLGSSGGSNLKQYIKDTDNLRFNLGDSAKQMQELQRIKARVRRAGNQQDRIANKVETTGYMSVRDVGTFSKNQAQIKNLDNEKEMINGVIHYYQDKQDTLRSQINSGLNTSGRPMTTEELNSAHYELKDVNKVLHKARDTNTAIEATQDIGASADETISSGLRFVGSKAALPLALFGIGKQIFSAFKGMVQAGERVNQSTGEQALNMGNVSGHASDSEMRGRVQNIMWSNGLGYNTQQGLDYMQLAQQSRAYRPNRANSGALSSDMTNALEEGGRFSGVSDKTWQATASSAMDSGAILSAKAINRLSDTLVGENMRSGNSGNAEQNAQIVTSVIQGLTRSGTLTSRGISTAAATTAMLSRSSKLFSGQQGQENVTSFNQGFLNAGSGGDDALLHLKINSNPAKYGGGPRGLLNAQEDLNKGLGDVNNIGWIQNVVRKMGNGGSQGQATAALMLEQHFGWKAETADKISQDMISGKYTPDKIREEIKRVDKQGRLQRSKNEQNYRSSEQAGYNTKNAQGEAINSRAAGSTKWWRGLVNNIGKGFNSVFNGGNNKSYTPTGQTGFMQPGQIGGRNTGTSGGTGKGALGFKPSAQDFGAPTKVHAATISRKDKPYKASKTQGVGASSSRTIDEKMQEESRTKAYLNTREMQRNLHSEKTNIDRRQEQLKEAARLLKEERSKSSGGSKGTAGTVGKSDSDSKSKSKSKSNSSSSRGKIKKPEGSDKKSKSSSSSSSKKSSKKLTNNNNITINMPATNGNPGAIGLARMAGNMVGEKVAELSRDVIQGE